MATYASAAPAFQGPTSVGNSATQIFNTTGTPIGSPSVDFATGANLGGLSVTNIGSVTCFLGTSSVTASTGTPLKPQDQMILLASGTNHLAAESGATSWNLYAITSSGTTTVEAALVSLPSVV